MICYLENYLMHYCPNLCLAIFEIQHQGEIHPKISRVYQQFFCDFMITIGYEIREKYHLSQLVHLVYLICASFCKNKLENF
jgi:hypothetical protein